MNHLTEDNTFNSNDSNNLEPSSSQYDKLIVTLYQSLNNKHGFDDFFKEFQQVFQCQCGGLFAIAPDPLRFLFSWSFGYPDGFEQWFVENNMIETDEGLHRYMAGTEKKFQSYVAETDEETFLPLISPETSIWAKQMGIVDSAGALICDNDKYKLVFSINRHESTGPFSKEDVLKLDSIAVHLEQAFQLYLTLYQSQQNSLPLQTALDLVNRPMAVVNLMVEVEYINQAGKQFLSQVDHFDVAHDSRLSFSNSEQQREFNDLLLTVGAFARQNEPQSKSTLFVFGAHKILLKVSPNMSEDGLLINLIVEFFDLNNNLTLPIDLIIATLECTPSEANVAKLLCEGLSVKEIAKHRHLSESTVREYVKNLLRKNDFNRQVDMISTLVRLAQ